MLLEGSIVEKIGKSERVAMASSIVFFLATPRVDQSLRAPIRQESVDSTKICIAYRTRWPAEAHRSGNSSGMQPPVFYNAHEFRLPLQAVELSQHLYRSEDP